MGDLHRKLAQLQSHFCEMRAELSAKQTTIAEQRQQISGLLAENERLRGRISLHSTEVAQKDTEAQRLRHKLHELEVQLEDDRRLLRASIVDFEAFKNKAQLESQSKDSTIMKLQAEIDGLILVNDDLQEVQRKKATELDGILTECNTRLHGTVQNEREKVKTVLEHCRVIITRLNTKVKESNDRNLLLETEIRTKLETIQGFREDIAEQKRTYREWIDLLKQDTIQKAPEESVDMHEEVEAEHDTVNDSSNEGNSSSAEPKVTPCDQRSP